jgi:plastocyanin
MGIRSAILLSGVLVGSCGGSTPPSGPDPPPSGPQIAISSSGVVSPKELTVSPGARVLFTNNDSRPHNMTSDPHPDHTDCTEINQVGTLSWAQTRETGNLVAVRTCGFHDHDDDRNTNLQGRIVIR